MPRAIDLTHGLEEFDEEEKRVDPLVISGFTIAFLSIVGIPLVLILRMFFH